MWPFSSSTDGIVVSKRTKRAADVAAANAYVPTQHSLYLRATASEIVRHIEKGEWTSSDVLEAYIARAAQAHEKTNCLTEVFFEQARLEAKHLDESFTETGKLVGLLHGVPMSVKDYFDVAGVDSTLGFTQWTNRPASRDSAIVHQLRTAGAIIIAKTIVSQHMLTFECNPALWGRATNSWSSAHTCGGSSGGEAALLALDGAALGMGTDLAGSLRIPASFCGIYSLKPGFGRIALEGSKGPPSGFEAVGNVAGPMGRSVEDIELISRLTFGVEDGDYFPVPLPYRDVDMPKKLKFGYSLSDNFVKASPVCQRAVLETVVALRREGHECIEFELPQPTSRPLEIFSGLASSDGYREIYQNLGQDKLDKSGVVALSTPGLPSFVRSLITWTVRSIIGDVIFSRVMGHSRKKTVSEYWQYTAKKNEFAREWNEEVWMKHGFDGLVTPVLPVPALPHGGAEYAAAIANATVTYNVVDSPVGCIPVTRLDPSLDQLTDEWFDGPGHGSQILERMVYGTKKNRYALYDVEAMKGLPVGVQLVGRKWQEEKVVEMMKVVDQALGKRGFGAGSSLETE